MRGTSRGAFAGWLLAAGRGADLGGVVGVILAGVDTLVTLRSGFDGPRGAFAAYALSSLVLSFGVLGALLGGWTALVGFVLPSKALGEEDGGRLRTVLRGLALGLPPAAFVAWVPTSWIVEHWDGLSRGATLVAVLVYPAAWLGCAVAAVLTDAALRRYRSASDALPRFHYPLLIAAALVAGASYRADRTILVGLYEDFHYGLTGLFASSVTLTLVLLMRTNAVVERLPLPRARHRAWLRALGCSLALTGLAVLELRQPDVFGPSSSVVFSKLVGTMRAWTDFDDDGVSSLLGGSDCAPFDPDATPGKFDVPGDARDEDCSGTAAQWPVAVGDSDYPIPDAAGFNLLLISIDALRADHLGAWGYTRHPTSPNIDRLAAQSLRFARAFAPAPKTYDSLPCLLTGLYPSNVPRDYKVEVPKEDTHKRPYLYRITREVELLSEILQRAGYVTGAAHGVTLLDYLDLDRGFDEHRTTPEQTEVMLDFLRRRVIEAPEKKPFFAWLHYYSPHHTYKAHEEYPFGDEEIDRYDAEIAYDDHNIGVLLTRMQELGLLERTVIVLTADHGEEFRDHGSTEHGFRLYSELVHVPLLLRIPGVAPKVVTDMVELADVTPTLCELLHLGDRCGEHDGHSLLEALAGKRDPARGAYSEMYRKNDVLLMNSLITDQFRVIFDHDKDRVELYDVVHDPKEQHNLASQRPELVRELRDRLATRTLYRQGLVFQRYRESGKSLDLAKGLPLFRRRELLSVVLREMQHDIGPRHVPYLKTFLERPGLDGKSKKRARALINRAEALAADAPH